MGEGPAARAPGRRWLPPAIGCALLIVSALLALGAPERLAVGSLALDDVEATVLVRTEGEVARTSRVHRVALDVIAAQIASDPGVQAVQPPEGPEDSRKATLVVTPASDDASAQQELVDRLRANIDPGPLRFEVAGEAATLAGAREEVGSDLWRLELLVAPLIVLVLAWGLGPRAAGTSLAAAALAILGSLAAMRLMDGTVGVSLLGIAAAAPVGLVLAVELTAMLRARHAALSRRGEGEPPPGLVLSAWRRSAAAAGVAAAVVPLALLATPLEQAGSLAFACALASGLSIAGVALFAPWTLSAPVRESGAWRRVGELAAALNDSSAPLALAWLPAVALAAWSVIGSWGVDSRGLGAPPDSGSLPTELAIAIAVVAILAAGAVAVLSRHVPLGLAGPLALLPAAAAFGAASALFADGTLATDLGLGHPGILETGALAAALCALASIAAARMALNCVVAREEVARADPWRATEAAAALTLRGSLLAALVAALAAGALAGADLVAAQQFGVMVAVGLVFELVLVRLPSLALATLLAGEVHAPGWLRIPSRG